MQSRPALSPGTRSPRAIIREAGLEGRVHLGLGAGSADPGAGLEASEPNLLTPDQLRLDALLGLGRKATAGALIEHPPARHLAAAKLAHYLDGTTEIQNVVISRALLKPFDLGPG